MTNRNKCTRIKRRQFIGTAASLATPWLVPAAALGLDGKAPPSGRVTLGFIGTGRRGTSNLKSLLPLDNTQVVATCDVSREARQQAAKVAATHYSGAGRGEVKPCKTYNDFRELLSRDDIDAVVITTQDHWHATIATAAAAAGKDIYCEKPFGVSVNQCKAIRDAVRRYERVLQTGTQQRSDAKFRQAVNLARLGHLGSVHTVEVAAPGPHYQPRRTGPAVPEAVPDGFDYQMYLGPAPDRPYTPYCIDWPGWYLIWDYCAGFVVNWGVHHLDIAHWGCPSIGRVPCTVACSSTYRTHPVCDNISSWQAEFVFDDGLKMKFTDTDNPLPQGTRFIGDEGWVHVNRKGIEAEPASLLDVRITSDQEGVYESNHHHADFIDSVLKRRDPVAPVEAGYVASYLGMLTESAGRLERKLRWDPVAEQFTADPDANRLLSRPMRSPWRV